MSYIADIGLEVHAELLTRSKMFCGCKLVDTTQAEANISVCPVCEGLPGSLPVVNQQAVELGLRVALALGCTVAKDSIFARKNYFYPDLPKGYQISQYEQPLAQQRQAGGGYLDWRKDHPHPPGAPGRRYRQADPCGARQGKLYPRRSKPRWGAVA